MVGASFDLRPLDELRIEATPHSAISLRLVSGSAEIFGYDLALSHWIKFPPDHKFAVSSCFLILVCKYAFYPDWIATFQLAMIFYALSHWIKFPPTINLQ